MDAGTTSHHLVELDGRLQIAEEDHRTEPFDIDARFKQIDGAGNESTFTGTAHGFDHISPVVRSTHALEGIAILGRLALVLAPAGIEIVHLHGYPVRVNLAVAENDHLLFRPTIYSAQIN
jgi:hypothetical protein